MIREVADDGMACSGMERSASTLDLGYIDGIEGRWTSANTDLLFNARSDWSCSCGSWCNISVL